MNFLSPWTHLQNCTLIGHSPIPPEIHQIVGSRLFAFNILTTSGCSPGSEGMPSAVSKL